MLFRFLASTEEKSRSREREIEQNVCSYDLQTRIRRDERGDRRRRKARISKSRDRGRVRAGKSSPINSSGGVAQLILFRAADAGRKTRARIKLMKRGGRCEGDASGKPKSGGGRRAKN